MPISWPLISLTSLIKSPYAKVLIPILLPSKIVDVKLEQSKNWVRDFEEYDTIPKLLSL